MEEKYAICPNCLQSTLQLDEQDSNMFICTKCQYKIPIDVYMMSLQLLQKDIIVEALRQFIRVPEHQTGYGMCVLYNNMKYVVGFDTDNELQIVKFDNPSWNSGSMIILNFNQGENNG